MLPFLKNKEGAASSDIARVEIGDSDDSYDMLDAISDDLMQAVTKRDKSLLKDTLQALCDYLQDMDEEQDKELLK